MLSIIIPARNEVDNLKDILDNFSTKLVNINFEVLIINDYSEDSTLDVARKLFDQSDNFKVYDNKKKGLGGVINLGIEKANGSKIAIMMADMSDHIDDLKNYNELMDQNNLDAIFGSRFINGSKINNYPFQKMILNRLFNLFVKIIFWNRYNDYTNAFKIYKKDALKNIMPLVSESFNIFLEIPLKIISRNYSYKIIPIRKKEKLSLK